MRQFCKDVIEFLESQYNDGYEYNVEYFRSLESPDEIEIRVKIGHGFVVRITSTGMNHIYSLYRMGEFCKEGDQYLWQKELIEAIEGS